MEKEYWVIDTCECHLSIADMEQENGPIYFKGTKQQVMDYLWNICFTKGYDGLLGTIGSPNYITGKVEYPNTPINSNYNIKGELSH